MIYFFRWRFVVNHNIAVMKNATSLCKSDICIGILFREIVVVALQQTFTQIVTENSYRNVLGNIFEQYESFNADVIVNYQN